VILLVIDARHGPTDQDQRLARMAFERGKGVVVMLHKWDTFAGDRKAATEVSKRTGEARACLESPQVMGTPALGECRDRGSGRGRGLDEAIEVALATARARAKRIPTADLNDGIARAVAEHRPPTHHGHPVKLYFATQADREPPFIVISANRAR